MRSVLNPLCLLLSALAVTSVPVIAAARPNFLIFNQTVVVPQHLDLIDSSPRENAALNAAPTVISVTFSQTLLPQSSSITLFDPYSRQIPLVRQQVEGSRISATIPGLSSNNKGEYKVQWTAHCACDDQRDLTGMYYFTVQ